MAPGYTNINSVTQHYRQFRLLKQKLLIGKIEAIGYWSVTTLNQIQQVAKQ